ncbi:MAG: phosphodiester glycosidase family protein [Phycisphaerales bacterium]|nr:phosphodiester glycosidase family protein [Phycisphaerales bacterium]
MKKSHTYRQLQLPKMTQRLVLLVVGWLVVLANQPPVFAREMQLTGIQMGKKKELATGVWYQHASDKSIPWEIDIIEIDLNEPTIEIVSIDAITPSLREKLPDLAKRGRAIAAINAGFFNMETGESVSHFELDDVIHTHTRADLPPRSTMGFTDGGAPKAIMAVVDTEGTPASHADEWKQVMHAIAGGPGLIDEGNVTITDEFEGFGKVNFVEKRHPRTAMGFNSKTNRMFWVTVDGRQPEWSVGMDLFELTHLMADLGCDNAMNFDGGGSTTCVANGKVVNRVSGKDRTLRAVSNAWIVRKALPEIIVDNDSPNASKSGNWSMVAEKGCFGNDALVFTSNSDDDKPAVITWSPTLPAPGEYLVEGWWVAGPDRTDTATFSLSVGDKTQEITVNQQRLGSHWNELGRLAIAEDSTPRITLTRSAAGTGSISADAIRLTKLGTAK